MSSTVHWKTRKSEPEPDRTILAFSPDYPKGDPNRHRVMGGQFLKNCRDVKYWAYTDEIEPTP